MFSLISSICLGDRNFSDHSPTFLSRLICNYFSSPYLHVCTRDNEKKFNFEGFFFYVTCSHWIQTLFLSLPFSPKDSSGWLLFLSFIDSFPFSFCSFLFRSFLLSRLVITRINAGLTHTKEKEKEKSHCLFSFSNKMPWQGEILFCTEWQEDFLWTYTRNILKKSLM